MGKRPATKATSKARKVNRGLKPREQNYSNEIHGRPDEDDVDDADSLSCVVSPLFPEGWLENEAGHAAREFHRKYDLITQQELAEFRDADRKRQDAQNAYDERFNRLLEKLAVRAPMEPGPLRLKTSQHDAVEIQLATLRGKLGAKAVEELVAAVGKWKFNVLFVKST